MSAIVIRTSIRRVIGALAVVGLLAAAQTAVAATVYAPDVTVAGKSQAEWSAEWMKWALAYPQSSSPMLDNDGSLAYLGDQPSVFFLGGSFGGDTVRTFTVPLGKPLFFPVANALSFQTSPTDADASIRQAATTYIDNNLLAM